MFTDGNTLSGGAGQIPVAAFTQRVADRLHAEDPRSWHRINAPGPFSDDTVAWQVGTSPLQPEDGGSGLGTAQFCYPPRQSLRPHQSRIPHIPPSPGISRIKIFDRS